MITSLYSQDATNINNKKSLSKKDSIIRNNQNSKGNRSSHNSIHKISSNNKFRSQINRDNVAIISYPSNSSQILMKSCKATKSKSCQNSSHKIPINKKGQRTMQTGLSTNRNIKLTIIKRKKKYLQRGQYQLLGTQVCHSKQKNLFYQGNNTQKITQFKTNSKQRISNLLIKKSNISQPKNNLSPPKWNEALVPYKYKQVIKKYSYYLTKNQLKQIRQYKNIYYIGHKVSRKIKQKFHSKFPILVTAQNENNADSSVNFDNQQHEYVYQMQDHVAFRYEIIQKMGKGSYGQVLKVYDHKKKQHVALKIVKNKTKFKQQAFTQIQILTHIKQRDPDNTSNIVRIKDFIIFRRHVCIVFQLLSQNLYQLIIRNNYNGLNQQLVRRIVIQILTGLQFFREHKIIHCDLKPQNIVLRDYNKSGIKIIDLGSSCFKGQNKFTYIQSRYYRAPEITLGIEYGQQIDMWSVGCIFGQLFTGIPLFPGQNQKEQLKYFIRTLGTPPKQMLMSGDRIQIFFDSAKDVFQGVMDVKSIQHFQKPLSQRLNDSDFCHFIQGFLKWNPKQRFTPVQALNHRWIKKGLPPQISQILPGKRLKSRKQSSLCFSQKGNLPQSQQKQIPSKKSRSKQGLQQTNKRAKKSSQLLRQKMSEIKNLND